MIQFLKVFIREGGRGYMYILIFLFVLVLGLSVFTAIRLFRSGGKHSVRAEQLLEYIRSVALFALAFAVFSQILGLVDIFDYLGRQDAGVSSSVLARGIKITFHPTLLGMIIYLFSILITLLLNLRSKAN